MKGGETVQSETVSPSGVPVPRRMDFPFDADAIPRRWFAGKALPTHVANGLNLLFPAGERFFIRSVRHYADRIDDPNLRARVRGFYEQEGHHAREHQRFFEIMEAQGLRIRPFLRWYERVGYEWLEKRIFSCEMALSTTVAAEHFTATLADRALSQDFLDHAHPVMAALLKWHAAEEIEHKSVAFDVLQLVNPSYRLRVQGLLLATTTLLSFWAIATVMLLRQERVTLRQLRRELHEMRSAGHSLDRTIRSAFVDYLRRDFHPSQIPNEPLARAHLATLSSQERGKT
jgi:hypothetical protein